MFKHLLVPLDGSRLAESVLVPARALAAGLGATITLVHVLEANPPEQVHGDPHLVNAAAAGAYLDRLADEIHTQGLRVTCHVHAPGEDDVAHSITRHAREMQADLVVLSTHGRSGLRQYVFGSIAQQVVGYGDTPVFISRPDSAARANQFRQLLVPLDGATDHESSLPVAADLAARFGAQLQLVTVVPRPADLDATGRLAGRFLPSATAALLDIQEAECRQYLETMAGRIRTTGTPVTCRVLRSDPATGILQSLREVDADLLVMATHARRGWTAFWSGSVGPDVLAQCGRPVLLIRAQL